MVDHLDLEITVERPNGGVLSCSTTFVSCSLNTIKLLLGQNVLALEQRLGHHAISAHTDLRFQLRHHRRLMSAGTGRSARAHGSVSDYGSPLVL